jgi:hypothetical protein
MFSMGDWTYNHDSSPDEHNARNEQSGPDFTDDDRSGDLEDGVCDEEYQRRDAVAVIGSVHVQVALHSEIESAKSIYRYVLRAVTRCYGWHIPSNRSSSKISPIQQADAVKASQRYHQASINPPNELLLLTRTEGSNGIRMLESAFLRVLDVSFGVGVFHGDGPGVLRQG